MRLPGGWKHSLRFHTHLPRLVFQPVLRECLRIDGDDKDKLNRGLGQKPPIMRSKG